jgi:DNA helicase-2/ATP-dependent DNA helicase PcrA
VDEYQDTNRPQYEIMRLLAGERHNVCAVGDEDQSIYSWRGADIRNILEFEQDFPEAKIFRLEQNYRSTENILQAASAVVANNVKRKGKRLWTSRQGGARIGYYEAPDGENEALFAADYISKFMQKRGEEGGSARAAVLYRTNSQSRLFEEALRRYGLSYHVVGGFSFYDRAEIKDMTSYLKLILNPADSVALMRVINTPTRGIGKTTMETVERIALETGVSLWDAVAEAIERKLLPQRATAALKSFRDMIEDARAMLSGSYAERLTESARGEAEVAAAPPPAAIRIPEPEPEAGDQHGLEFGSDVTFAPETFADAALETAAPPPSGAEEASPRASTAELLKFLLDRTGYMRFLEQEDTPEAEQRIENLRELINAALDSRDRGESVSEFLDHAALVSDADQYDAAQQITLMTLHAAKGLEFPLVFLVGMEEGLFPHAAGPGRYRGGAPALLRGHDARHGYLGAFAGAPPPPLRNRYAGADDAFAIPGGGSGGAAGRPGFARPATKNKVWRFLCGRFRAALRLRERGSVRRLEQRLARWLWRRKNRLHGANLQLNREHCRFFCLARQALLLAENRRPGAHRQARFPQGRPRQTPEIWRRNRLSSRRRG